METRNKVKRMEKNSVLGKNAVIIAKEVEISTSNQDE